MYSKAVVKHLLVLGLCVLAGSAFGQIIQAGAPLPVLAAERFEGTIPELAGQVVLVDFWASWCVPCKRSFPDLEALHTAYREKGLIVLGINEDEKARSMEKFLQKVPVTFPIIRDLGQAYVAQVGVETMPSSLLVDRAGKVRYVHAGYHGEETLAALKEQIEELLAEEAP